jgi:hypothetical protein
MSFEKTLKKHANHEVVIIPRVHKNRSDPVPGLYCAKCCKLVKWLSYDEWEDLVDAGVEELPMLKAEEQISRKKSRLITAAELGI